MDVTLGVAGAASIVEAATVPVPGPLSLTCTLTPAPAAGPYYLPLGMVRRDLTEGTAGVPLMLRFRIVDATTRQAVRGAVVDVRHRDAGGRRLLRGVQMSDAEGDVQFRTIFPGWCAGRSIHLHARAYVGGRVTHTGQFFVDERLAQQMADLPPYRANRVARTPNADDAEFSAGGLLLVVPRDRFDLEAGLLASVTVAVDGGNTTVTEGSSAPRGMLG